jgi:hypothetical protein
LCIVKEPFRRIVTFTGYVLIHVVLIEYFVWSDPISLVLCAILVLAAGAYLLGKSGKYTARWVVGVLSCLLFLLRWNWIVAIVISAGVVGAAYGLVFCRPGRRYWDTVISVGLGVLAGFGILLFYLWRIQAIREGLQTLFIDQVVLNGAYRQIPLPMLFREFAEGVLVTLTMAMFVVLGALYILIKDIRLGFEKERDLVLFLIAGVASFIPYVLSRSDIAHVLPMVCILGLSCVILYAATTKNLFIVIFFILLAPLSPRLFNHGIVLPKKSNFLMKYISKNIENCAGVAGGRPYGSMYVGKLNYDFDSVNIGHLYFVHPEIPPASKYFLTVPGIQSSCRRGEVIAGDLDRAKKPMLVFLDLNRFIPDNPHLYDLKSCGKIETYLKQHAFTTMGTCHIFDHEMLVRVYDQ